MSRERPILFSAPMVRAILEGRKTQTRRVVSKEIAETIEWLGGHADGDAAETDDIGLAWGNPVVEKERGGFRTLKHPEWMLYSTEYPDEGSIRVGCGYGAVGDQLWVRETWCRFPADAPDGMGENIYYRATQRADDQHREIMARNGVKWRPSIFMPRSASRITLEVTGVRVERLQDISEYECWSEGIHSVFAGPEGQFSKHPIAAYRELWESINGAESWAANPWVWVIEFKRITP